MTIMLDKNGHEHEIRAIGNVFTLQSIGWTVKAVDSVKEPVATVPATEQEWDAIFGRR